MATAPFTAREAKLDDLPIIVSIYNATVPGLMVTADTEPVAVESRVAWFEEHNSKTRPLLVFETPEGETIGWVSFQDFYGRPAYNGTAEISIYVHEKFQGKGWGRTLLQYSIDLAPKLNIHTLLGFVFAHNVPSLALFEKMGFKEWGYLPGIANLKGEMRGLKILGRRT